MSASRIRDQDGWARRPGWPRRLVWLYGGLAGFGLSLALMVKARLGLDPWDVLHQGIARHLGIQIGWVVIGVSAVVLAAWIPLRQRPGVGTISNAVVVGLVVNGALAVLPTPDALAPRLLLLAAAIVLTGLATGCYLGAGLGPGPRDGLMTGLARRGHSVRLVRTAIEVSVLALGVILGGSVGIGTVAYALAIGPLVHVFLPRLAVAVPAGQPPDDRGAPCRH
ncbi:MAG: YczE/YyaS/YitT family protein [Acidimicrobiales bacterium]